MKFSHAKKEQLIDCRKTILFNCVNIDKGDGETEKMEADERSS